jgi:hypothetical protein
MVRVALTGLGSIAALSILLLGGAARAQDVAARPAYPVLVDESAPAPAAKRAVRRPVVKRAVKAMPARTVNVRLPQHRPARPEPKEETVAKAVPLPPVASRPQAVVQPEPAPVKQAALPPKDVPPPEPAITLGGRNDWRMITDAATGVIVGVPGRLLTEMRDAAHGTLWSSPHGEIQLETFKYAEPGLTVNALYERMKRDGTKRKIEWSKLNDDGFVFGGMQGLKYFSVHAKAQNGELRGYTLMFDQAMEGILEPVVPAIAKAFTPFPQNAAPSVPPAKVVKFGSGIVVSREGHILTSAGVTADCDALLANGIDPAERIAVSDGLALLRAPGIDKLTPMAIASAEGASVLTLAGVPDPREQKGGAATRYVAARLMGDALELVKPKPLEGYAGAAALDAQGRLAGVLDMSDPHLAGTGVSPLRLINAKAIRAFLSAHGIDADAQPGEPRSGILRVVCVRK